MSPKFTYLAALEPINELLPEAEQGRIAGELRSSRRPKPRGAGTSQTASAATVTLRFSRPADDRALERLAQLDSARPLHGPHLVAEVGSHLHAAISLTDGAVIADPFHHTNALVELLRARAIQLTDQRTRTGAPTSVLRELAALRKRSWLAAS